MEYNPEDVKAELDQLNLLNFNDGPSPTATDNEIRSSLNESKPSELPDFFY